MNDETTIIEAPHTPMVPLKEWRAANIPREDMVFRDGFFSQVDWVADVLYYMMAKALTSTGEPPALKNEVMLVEGDHTSKNIRLPVYRFQFKGVVVKLRDNMHDWCVKVWGGQGIDLPDYMEIENVDGYYEGMEDDTDPCPPDHRFCVGNREKVYAILMFLLNTIRERQNG